MALTVKQEKFCQAYIETGNASEAYRQAYDASKMKPETVNRTAKELLDNPKITARVNALKNKHEKRHDITVDSLVKELEEVRMMALTMENPQLAPAINAIMGKAKLLGMDKQVIDLTTNGESFNKPTVINLVGKTE